MSNLLNAKILSKKVAALAYFNFRIKEADYKGITHLNIQGSYIPVERGSVMYEELKLQRNNIELEINTYTISKQPDSTVMLPKSKLGKSYEQPNVDFINSTTLNLKHSHQADSINGG